MEAAMSATDNPMPDDTLKPCPVTDEMIEAGREPVIGDWKKGYISDTDLERIYLAMQAATPSIIPVAEGEEGLKPCRECGGKCRVETFEGSHLKGTATIWLCAHHKMFWGKCPSDTAYLTAGAWNATQPIEATPSGYEELVEAARSEMIGAAKEAEARGKKLDWKDLAKIALDAAGVPALLQAAKDAEGMREALQRIVDDYEGKRHGRCTTGEGHMDAVQYAWKALAETNR